MIDYSRLDAIVREAGLIAMSSWPGAGHSVRSWDKGTNDPVCEADIAVDDFLQRELSALLPSAGWLSEETADQAERLDDRLVWVVDPIDGTRDFIRGRAGWAVSVALVSSGRPLIALLEAPARSERWLATAGQGATLNGERLAASRRKVLEGARIPAADLAQADKLFDSVDQPNGIALRAAMVAADRADLVATMRWGYEWDIAAATLIAREAGAAVSDIFGQPLGYNKRDPRCFGLLVCAPGLQQAAIEHFGPRARERLGTARGPK
ncbi:MAG: 3'(2'),5'-bisphosphate nucleotidase CysQ [Erythrobacter sp.]|nr:3'(2'),5'-bisphosphate nucleotidase CysQ [Erythrobacter sp.]NCQ62801.1 3'(2'),5'-bisphosphate nucleotidase CysQ [Alphaproteobacteria bacterium]